MAEQKIEMRDGEILSVTQTIGSTGDIEIGHMVAVLNGNNTSARLAADTANHTVIGVAEATQAGSVSGALVAMEVRRKKVFKMKNSTTNPIVTMFGDAYVEDSETVCVIAGATNNIIAGTVIDYDADNVWVEIG